MRPVMTEADVTRVLRRIAHEVLEHHQGAEDLVLVGIHTRGAPLARRLAELMSEFEGTTVPHGSLDIGMYRDDLDRRPTISLGPTKVPTGIDGKTVVLVDDVLYTGRTIRAALDALADLGRARSVQLVVLIDRGHRELPIRADYVGKNIPTAPDERVTVLVNEVDDGDGVWIEAATIAAKGGTE